MKKILILFGKKSWYKKEAFSDKKYVPSYEILYSIFAKGGLQMYRASYQWYDYKKNIFKYAWTFEKNNGGWKRVYNIKPNLIFDKTKSFPEDELKKNIINTHYPFFNNIEFSKIIDNKLGVSLIFQKWFKKSILLPNQLALVSFLENFPSNRMLVLKPINLSGGENVLIGKKADILKKIYTEKIKIHNWLAQDFIDSSFGIPGIMKGVHDLRLVIINKNIVYAYFRTPAKGSLLANLAQGGSMQIVPLKKLPSSISPIIKAANELFSEFSHKFYAIDLMFDQNKKPWIVELNSMPGMYFDSSQEKIRHYFYHRLLNIFKTVLK